MTSCVGKRASGGTNFGKAMEAAEKQMNNDEHTVLIFLTDGQGHDDAGLDGITVTNRIRRMKSANPRLQFWVVKFCTGDGGQALRNIAQAGGTHVQHSIDVITLNEFFVKVIAKKTQDFSLMNNKK